MNPDPMLSTPSAPPPEPLARETPATRIALLRREIEASSDVHRQAVLHYEIGHLIESSLGRTNQAVMDYLAGFNLEPSFGPPLFSLTRIFEASRSTKNLERLYEVLARTQSGVIEQSSALVDWAVLLSEALGRSDEAAALYSQAVERNPDGLAALLFYERYCLSRGDLPRAMNLVLARAARTQSPQLRSALWIEAAHYMESVGEIDRAIDTLRTAAAQPEGHVRALEALEHLAERHGRTMVLTEALAAHADALSQSSFHELEAWSASMNEGADEPSASTSRSWDLVNLTREAVALWRDAARVWSTQVRDFNQALQAYNRALSLRPHDILLRYERMFIAEFTGDLATAADDARVLLTRSDLGKFSAPLYFRIAEFAQARRDVQSAKAALLKAIGHDPQSATAHAIIDDLWLDDDQHELRASHLQQRMKSMSAPAQAETAWLIAHLYADLLADVDNGWKFYQLAMNHPTHRSRVLRELVGMSLRFEHVEYLQRSLERMLEHARSNSQSIDAREISVLLREEYELLRQRGADSNRLRQWLHEALSKHVDADWIPHIARLHAGQLADFTLLAHAHRALADKTHDNETFVAHKCAEARAWLHEHRDSDAIDCLREAADRAPSHPLVIPWLEILLRRAGKRDEIVTLLRRSAQDQDSRAAEYSLLVAAAEAEITDNAALAADTYLDAIRRNPNSIAAAWGLYRLGVKHDQGEWIQRGRSERLHREKDECVLSELALDEALALHLDHGRLEDARRFAESVLASSTWGAAAAAMLADTLQGVAALAELEKPSNKQPWLEALAQARYARVSTGDSPSPPRDNVSDELADRELSPTRWSSFFAWRHGSGRDRRAQHEALLQFAEQLSPGPLQADLFFLSLIVLWILPSPTGESSEEARPFANLDAFEHLCARIVTSCPDTAVATLTHELLGSRQVSLPVQLTVARARSQMEPEVYQSHYARLLMRDGRHDEAVPVLKSWLVTSPNDAAAWDHLRVAARAAKQWREVVTACDKLSARATGGFRADLLEEAGVVFMDELQDLDSAAERFRLALQSQATRTIAFHRLHRIYADRSESQALLDLIARRIEVVDDADDLVRLYYEEARLLRSTGQLDEALQSIENLLLLDGAHAGGLALKSEIHVCHEQWDQAADALHELGHAENVPIPMRRIALLGAADFFQNRVGDLSRALGELYKVVELGRADVPLYIRLAAVAEQAKKFSEASTAWRNASELASGAGYTKESGRYAYRAAAIASALHRGGTDTVITHRCRLLDEPANLEPMVALMEIQPALYNRQELLDEFEKAVRSELSQEPTSASTLRKLGHVANWRSSRDTEYAVIETLGALGLWTEDERTYFEQMPTRPAVYGGATLGQEGFSWLYGNAPSETFLSIAKMISEMLAELDSVGLGRWGVTKGDRISPRKSHLVRDEVVNLIGLFQGKQHAMYVAHRDEHAVGAVQQRDEVYWVIGEALASPISAAHRFHTGRIALASHEGLVALLDRSDDDALHSLLAAAQLADVHLSDTIRASVHMEHRMKALSTVMNKKRKKALSSWFEQWLGEQSTLQDALRSVRLLTLKAGLLASGDLRAALRAVMDADTPLANPGPPTNQPLEGARVNAMPYAKELVLFWVSVEAAVLRKGIGIAL